MDDAPSVYGPLGEREFRVLLLHSETDGLVGCELKALNLDTNLSYVALSYTWGQSDDSAVILLHGQRKRIQKNLAEALARLFNLGHFVVWADSISINQEDVVERNSQVAIMRNIFEKAREVIVWLGKLSRRLNLPAAFVKHFCSLETSGNALWRPGVIEELNSDPKTLHFLQDIMACDYWVRAWIIQEIAIASDVQIVFGRNKVNWSHFENLIEVAYSMETEFMAKAYYEFLDSVFGTRESDDGCKKLYTLRHLRRQRGQSLLTILNLTMGTKQRDPRDAIYSKLGLAIDSAHILRTLDYSKEPREVYIELVTKHIEIKQRLDILCSVELPNRFGQDTENLRLPSWVPDWRVITNRASMVSMIPTKSPSLLFDAGDGAIQNARITSDPKFEVLSVHGFVFDEIRPSRPKPALLDATTESQTDALHDPFVVLSQVCRTLATDQLYTHSYTATEPVPDRTIAHFIEILVSYYYTGDIDETLLHQNPLLVHDTKRMLDRIGGIQVGGWPLTHWISKCKGHDLDADRKELTDLANVNLFIYSMGVSIVGRSIVQGQTGRVYLVPDVVQDGDLIVVLRGCAMPMALRRYRARYAVVGACFTHGIMRGEAMREYRKHSNLTQFDLV